MHTFFERYMYPMLYIVNDTCLDKDACPAIQAEKAQKTVTEICQICDACFNKLQKSRSR